jgi:hypothetical protein
MIRVIRLISPPFPADYSLRRCYSFFFRPNRSYSGELRTGMAVAQAGEYPVGSLVRVREWDWVVVPSDDDQIICLRPLSGSESEMCGIHRAIEGGICATPSSHRPTRNKPDTSLLASCYATPPDSAYGVAQARSAPSDGSPCARARISSFRSSWR